MKSNKIPLYFSYLAVAWLHYQCQIELICESSPLPVKQGIIFGVRRKKNIFQLQIVEKRMINTCLLITGPRSASGSIPEFTLRVLARSTSLSSLEKGYICFMTYKILWLQFKEFKF